MKRHFLTLFSLGALAASTALAQGPPFPDGPRTPPDPATMVARQVERLTQQLTLTAAQQTQATTIFTNSLSAVTPIRTNLQTAQTSLRAAVLKGDTASIDNLAAQIGSLTGQELDIQSKAQAAFYKILTADQQTKYSTAHGRGGFGGPSGPGGPGGLSRGPRAQRFGGQPQ